MIVKVDRTGALREYWSEFNRRLITDEAFAAKLPDGAVVFLLPESEPEACARAKEEAMEAARWMATRLVKTDDEREYTIAELPDQSQEVVFVTIPKDGGEWDIVPAEQVLDLKVQQETVVMPMAHYRALVQYIAELEEALSGAETAQPGSGRARVIKDILAEYRYHQRQTPRKE